MSFTALNWAWAQTCRNGIAKSVLVYLANCADRNGECFPSIPTIARIVQHGEASVKTAIRGLIEDRLLEREQRERNSYRFRLPVSIIKEGGGYEIESTPLEGVGTKSSPPPTPGGVEIDSPLDSNSTPYTSTDTEERKIVELRSTVPAVPDTVTPLPDIKDRLWKEGKQILRRLSGKSDDGARRMIGKLLNKDHAQGDASLVFAAIKAAEREELYEPIPWIVGRIMDRMRSVKARDPAVQIGLATGQFEPEQREKFRSGLTVDYSAFGKETAHG